MRRITTIMLLLLLPLLAMAQPSREQMKKALMLSGDVQALVDDSSQSLDQLVRVAKSLNPALTDGEAQKKIQEYMTSRYMDDMADIVRPYYTLLTDADCEKLAARIGTPEAQARLKRISRATANSQLEVGMSFQKISAQMMTGELPENIKRKSASDSWVRKFNRYAEIADLEGITASALNNITQQMSTASAMLPDEQMAALSNMMRVLSDYLLINVKSMAHNIMVGSVTEEDLQFYIDTYSTPEGQHMIEGSRAMAKDALNMGQKIVEKMVVYLNR